MTTKSNPKPASTNLDSIFNTYEIQRLTAIQRLLLGLGAPGLANQAARLGYSTEEHAAGWRDLAQASGWDVPFHYYLSEADRRLTQASAKDQRQSYQILDRVENKWFPRARNAIRRFVAEEHREAFEQAFFQDLQQQPEGPQVVGSVRVLLDRIEAMQTSDVPGVKDALQSLEEKGLTEERRHRIRAEIEAVTEPAMTPDVPAVSAAEIEASARARREAYERLNLWYIEWAEVFRSELGYMTLQRLGLVPHKGGRRRATEATDGSSAPATPAAPQGSATPPDAEPPAHAI